MIDFALVATGCGADQAKTPTEIPPATDVSAATPTPALTPTETPEPTPSAEKYVEQAEALMETGDLGAALEDLDRAIELDPENAQAHFLRGLVNDDLPNFESALGSDHIEPFLRES
jgi:Tfp pilus assembly protein PilF